MRSVEDALITLGGFGGSGFTWIDLVFGGVGFLAAETTPCGNGGQPQPPPPLDAESRNGAHYEVCSSEKFCSECGAESAPAGQRLPAAGGDRAWAARTGSGPMWMCCDIFAAASLWRGRLLTTGRLSCSHPVVV